MKGNGYNGEIRNSRACWRMNREASENLLEPWCLQPLTLLMWVTLGRVRSLGSWTSSKGSCPKPLVPKLELVRGGATFKRWGLMRCSGLLGERPLKVLVGPWLLPLLLCSGQSTKHPFPTIFLSQCACCLTTGPEQHGWPTTAWSFHICAPRPIFSLSKLILLGTDLLSSTWRGMGKQGQSKAIQGTCRPQCCFRPSDWVLANSILEQKGWTSLSPNLPSPLGAT